MNITGIDRERLQKIQELLVPLITIDKLEINKKSVKTVKLADARWLSFITSSADGKWLFTGGWDKILSVIDRQSNSIHLQVPLQSFAGCCYMKGNMLFIGGVQFIQVFDCAKLTIIKTIDASNLIYKIVAINDDHLLCGGYYMLMVLRVSDFTVIAKEDTQSVIYDIVRVNKENEFALATYEKIKFIKIIDPVTFAIEKLPRKFESKNSRIS